MSPKNHPKESQDRGVFIATHLSPEEHARFKQALKRFNAEADFSVSASRLFKKLVSDWTEEQLGRTP